VVAWRAGESKTYVSGCAHGDLHGEHGAGDDEVEEPLGRSTHGDVEGAESGGGDFTVTTCQAPEQFSAQSGVDAYLTRIQQTGPQPNWKKTAQA
jgi:hypothetical protein